MSHPIVSYSCRITLFAILAGLIELSFPKPVTIRAVDVYSGWKDDQKSVLADFDIALQMGGKWIAPVTNFQLLTTLFISTSFFNESEPE